VEPDARGHGIAKHMVCTLIDRRFVEHFARWRFTPIDPSQLQRSVLRVYRIGRVVTAPRACCAGSGYASWPCFAPLGDVSRLTNGVYAGRLELHRFVDVTIRGGELGVRRIRRRRARGEFRPVREPH
jgi:hypothetical protein